ncbi:MAG: MFS transporter [Deltaproteobacteria bacterium]|nr:MFS transporter [Deltaproteobacteria bacterium]
MSSASVTETKKNPIVAYFADFKVLKDNPKEFWGIQAINFLDSTAYFAMLSVAMLYLRTDLGFGLKSSGYVMTAFTSMVTISMLFSGVVGDVMGVRKSLWLSMGLKLLLSGSLLALGLVKSIPGRQALVVLSLLAMAPMLALIQTVFQAANVRFTSKRSRSAGFNLWYLFMNVGAFVAGEVIDRVRLTYKLPNAWIVGFGAATSLLALLVTGSLIHSEKQVHGPDEAEAEAAAAKKDEVPKKKALEILKDMVRESAFWRFLCLVGVLLGVRAVFVYIYMLMPQYWIEVMGKEAPIGLLNQINPFLIVAGLILFIPIANRWSVFRMLTVGAIISALSLFVLTLPWTMFSTDFGRAHFRMSATMMVVLSIGEVIWSPKLSEYTAAIAPKGQEGAYLGMSMMPWFIAKMAVSAMSGHMLERWSPDGIGDKLRAGQVDFWHSPSGMWFVLGIWALSGPIIALMAEKWLTKGARWKAEDVPAPGADAASEAA